MTLTEQLAECQQKARALFHQRQQLAQQQQMVQQQGAQCEQEMLKTEGAIEALTAAIDDEKKAPSGV